MNNYYLFRLRYLLAILFISSIYQTSNSQDWSPLGVGTNNSVNAAVIFNSQLIAAGNFSTAGGQSVNHIASWNGTSWQPLGLGTNGNIHALVIYNGLLVAGGEFTAAGGISANKIAAWNGSVWSRFDNSIINGNVYSIAVFGTSLIIGGNFTTVGSTVVNRVARLSSGWFAMGNGFNSTVYALSVFNSQLFAGGSFTGPGTVKRIGLWNGVTWITLGTGIDDGAVYALKVHNSWLAVGGSFTYIGGSSVNRIARWNGANWGILGSGFSSDVNAFYASGTTLYAGGNFDFADYLPASKVAVYNGSGWTALGTGIGGTNANVKSIVPYNGKAVFAGTFSLAGGNSANNIATWGTPIEIKPIAGEVPGSYSLEQNYPNPFNPVTSIRFSIPSSHMEKVKLTVFDISGREVAVLVNNTLAPGKYEVNFDAGNLGSGAYFYKLTAGLYSETKRMVVVK
ncbi:MAG TPA: T9SS type A sorting domain-containing protein [Ignavibacteria bacterium]|nr:T9SS type A sorting domain-containing protein [Ignavibacteria bacterium]